MTPGTFLILGVLVILAIIAGFALVVWLLWAALTCGIPLARIAVDVRAQQQAERDRAFLAEQLAYRFDPPPIDDASPVVVEVTEIRRRRQ